MKYEWTRSNQRETIDEEKSIRISWDCRGIHANLTTLNAIWVVGEGCTHSTERPNSSRRASDRLSSAWKSLHTWNINQWTHSLSIVVNRKALDVQCPLPGRLGYSGMKLPYSHHWPNGSNISISWNNRENRENSIETRYNLMLQLLLLMLMPPLMMMGVHCLSERTAKPQSWGEMVNIEIVDDAGVVIWGFSMCASYPSHIHIA